MCCRHLCLFLQGQSLSFLLHQEYFLCLAVVKGRLKLIYNFNGTMVEEKPFAKINDGNSRTVSHFYYDKVYFVFWTSLYSFSVMYYKVLPHTVKPLSVFTICLLCTWNSKLFFIIMSFKLEYKGFLIWCFILSSWWFTSCPHNAALC